MITPNYECDNEFLKLLSHHSDVDLTMIALEIARDVYPGLDFSETLNWIDDRADELAGVIAIAETEEAALKEISKCLCDKHGIQGRSDSFHHPESSFLNKVIETGSGIPISLSILYMAIGNRLGMTLTGVASPMHFLVRYESMEGPLFIDAFSRCRILKEEECIQWLNQISSYESSLIESSLGSAEPRYVVIRLLNNLKTLYASKENWKSAWMIQHRLTGLQPSDYASRRDLGVFSVLAERPDQAIDLLKSCLNTCPESDKELLQNHLDIAEKQIARFN
jgi:regulator of sirC expression with transglutaminase-like and TPR domain